MKKTNDKKRPNKWNRLLLMLDRVYGFVDKKHSAFRKVGQHFDERTGEHVVILEYRVRRGSDLDQKSAGIEESTCSTWPMIQEMHQMTADQ